MFRPEQNEWLETTKHADTNKALVDRPEREIPTFAARGNTINGGFEREQDPLLTPARWVVDRAIDLSNLKKIVNNNQAFNAGKSTPIGTLLDVKRWMKKTPVWWDAC